MILTLQDQMFLKTLSDEYTEDLEQRDQIFIQLKYGYELYGIDSMIQQEDRQEFFKCTSLRLLENLKYAGKNSEDVFTQSKPHIRNILRRLKVPHYDIDDLTDTIVIKFWYSQYAEKYNPLISSWKYYVFLAVSRTVASYLEKRQRDSLAMSFSYQQYDSVSKSPDKDMKLELYEVEQDPTPEQWAIYKEVLSDFERYLSKQEPFRDGIPRSHAEICTLLPPGIKDHKLKEPEEAYLIRRGTTQCHRIELKGGASILWPINLMCDIKSITTQSLSSVKRLKTPLSLYRLLMDRGAQVEQLATILHIGNSTAHNWVRQLEDHFKTWWCKSDLVPIKVKHLVFPVRKCLGCEWEHIELPERSISSAIKEDINGEQHWKKVTDNTEGAKKVNAIWCDICGLYALDSVKKTIELSPPWGYIRRSHDLIERSNKRKKRLFIQRCSI